MQKKPNAFFLLSQIANTARRTAGGPDGLLVGQCHLKHWKKYDLTEQEYRTAKKILVERGHILILETNRTRQKSTTGSTTVSTLVQLISLTVYDINSEDGNDRINDRSTTDQRLNNDKQEGRRKKKNEKEESPQSPQKIKFREFVEMTQTEHDSLLAKHGQEFLAKMLDALNSYKGSTGKKYASDFHTMKEGGWVIERVRKDLENQKTPNEKNFRSSSATPPGNTAPSTGKFEPSRVLRGSNDALEGNQGVVHE